MITFQFLSKKGFHSTMGISSSKHIHTFQYKYRKLFPISEMNTFRYLVLLRVFRNVCLFKTCVWILKYHCKFGNLHLTLKCTFNILGNLGEFVPKCCHIQTRQIFSLGILLQNLRTLDFDLRTSVKFIFPNGFIYRKAKFKLQHLALQWKI